MTVVEDGGDDKYIFDHEIADLEKHYILYRLYIWSIKCEWTKHAYIKA